MSWFTFRKHTETISICNSIETIFDNIVYNLLEYVNVADKAKLKKL